jgi:hypothetical protein
MKAEAGTNRIVRWQILKGLPSEGPIPKQFHLGHPTPWAQGFVVQFWNEDGTKWVGNFQCGWSPVGIVVDWPEAVMVVVIAYGACYFLPKADPERYDQHGHGVISALLDEGRTLLILANRGGELASYGQDGREVWSRKNFAVDGIELESCKEGIITAEIEYDYEGSWRTAQISATDGSDL